jgi:2-dehydro-3-deoxy-D-arabinonate dehydratase
MKLCRFASEAGEVLPGLVLKDATVLDLKARGIASLTEVFENPAAFREAERLAESATGAPVRIETARLAAPVDGQEVWAAGVTYLRSKTARMEESDFSATAYDRVYEAERPEIFFKSLAEKAVGPADAVGIRRDARWSVPEPELVLIFDSKGEIRGYTAGNDMSSRDIEGENLLYLPQAKIYDRSCALGPWIVTGPSEEEARAWSISVEISREGRAVFGGQTSVGQIRRSFKSLGEFLFRSQRFPHGAALLTGTGIVPPDNFTLAAGDEIEVKISGVGAIKNRVEIV